MRIGATAWLINSDYPTQKLNPLGDDKRTMKQRYKIQQQIELYKFLKFSIFKWNYKNYSRIKRGYRRKQSRN